MVRSFMEIIKPKGWLAAGVIGLIALGPLMGCEAKDRDEALRDGQEAVQDLSNSFGPTLAKAQKLTEKSSREALVESQKDLAKLQRAAVRVPQQLAALKKQADRLDLLAKVQNLQKAVETKASEVKKGIEQVKETSDKVTNGVAQAKRDLAKLQEQLQEVRAKVEQATQSLGHG